MTDGPSWLRPLGGFVAAALLALVAGDAHATPDRKARLALQRGPGAADCPDEATIRSAVFLRLGYDAIDPTAADLIQCVITRDAHDVRARIRLTDAGGRLTAERELVSARPDCRELGVALGLTLSLAINPVAGLATPGTPAARPTAATTSVPAVRPLSYQVALGTFASAGVVPALSTGLIAGVMAGRGAGALGVEARGDWPASKEVDGGTVRAWRLGGALVGCLRRGRAAACAVAGAGMVHAAAVGFASPRTSISPVASLGARLAWDQPVGGRWSIVTAAEGAWTAVQTRFDVEGHPGWTTPAASVTLGVAAAAHFR